MLQCPYWGCHSLTKNGSTRGVPKWKGKTCGRQTSLRGPRAETDPEKERKQGEAVLLSLSGRSLNAVAQCGRSMRSLNAVAQCGRAMRSRNAVAQCGRAMRSRNAVAQCGRAMR